MWKLLLPLLLIACTTEPEDGWTEKAFTKADCGTDLRIHWKPSAAPSQWQAYIQDGHKKTPVELAYEGEFEIGCSFPDSGSFVIYYR